MTAADFVVERLVGMGIRHFFTVVGIDIHPVIRALRSYKDVEIVPTTSEWSAALAADGYARARGMGCCLVTYAVGGLNCLNAIACANAEKSPVVVLSGGPSMKDREQGGLLPHMARNYCCQEELFQRVTCASTVLSDSTRAGFEVDRVLEVAKAFRQPVYIEIPRDMASRPLTYDAYNVGTPSSLKSDQEVLGDAVKAAVEYINSSRRPVILAGVEVSRFGLGPRLLKFAERTNIPIATTLLGKSAISERHPLALGVYAGNLTEERTRVIVEESDCVIMLGVLQTDVAFEFLPQRIHARDVILSTADCMRVRSSHFRNVFVSDFLVGLASAEVNPRTEPMPMERQVEPWQPRGGDAITVTRFFQKINSVLDANKAVVSDVGDALFGAADLVAHDSNHFISPAFYPLMGTAIPSALGVMKAKPGVRAMVFVGDGAMQMSMPELSTFVRQGLPAAVFVINNHGYQTERLVHDGSWCDVADWSYESIPSVIGGGHGVRVATEGEMDEAVDASLCSDRLTVVNVVIKPGDVSPALARYAKKFKQRF